MDRVLRHRWRILGGALLAAAAVGIFLGSYRFDATSFDPTTAGPFIVEDRHGTVLRRVPSEGGRPGREGWVPLASISSHAVLTLLASEDQAFFEHHGVDPASLLRALWLSSTTSRTYGGSTLTMQLARLVGSQGKPRSVWVKLLEMRAALGIERNLSKGEILEQYLNRAYYGRGAYGIEAAAFRYFGKPARSLSAGEATFLTVLPRGPSHYDPIRHRNRVLERRRHLLRLLVEQGRLTPAEASRAESQQLQVGLHPFSYEAPHFVDWVLGTVPEETLERGGTLRTTLDLPLQHALEHRTREHVEENRLWDISDAGAVVLDTETGEVLAMVGSRDYGAPAGQMNMTTWRRFPGSALKPFVYAVAMEGGHSPASVAFDVRDISDGYRDPGPERGPVAFREALAGSYNFAAVDVLQRVGLERVMDRLRHAGVSRLRLAPSDYGVRLALGSTKVRLLDLSAGYRFTVRAGRVRAPTGALDVRRGDHIVWRGRSDQRQVFSEEASWLVMDMLSDPEARRPMFGDELPVDLPYRVVAKTGTAEGFADTVAILATHELIVGAWTGRTDGGSIQGRPGMAAAAPLARAALLLASEGRQLTLPAAPEALVEASVCPLSGLRPGPHCPHRRHDHFRRGTAPRIRCDWHGADGGVTYPDALTGWARRTGSVARAGAAGLHGSRVMGQARARPPE